MVVGIGDDPQPIGAIQLARLLGDVGCGEEQPVEQLHGRCRRFGDHLAIVAAVETIEHHAVEARHLADHPHLRRRQVLDLTAQITEEPVDVGWGIRFHVKHVLMTWSTGQEDHDDGFVVAFDTGTRFGRQELRQGETAERETPDGHKITSTQAITEAALIISPDCQHGNIALPRPGITGHTIMWFLPEYSR